MPQLRIALRLVAIVAALLVALILHGLWRLAGRPSPWPRRFLGALARIVGARPHRVGHPLGGDVVIVANHLSWIDIPLLAGATGCVFVAKAELAAVPLIGWLCGLNRTIFIARADRLGVAAQIGRLRAALAAGDAVTIFPEGTTGDGHTLRPFKPTLLAALDGAPAATRVQPVRIDYGGATGELAWTGDEPGRHHALRVLARRGRFDATLTFLDAFDPATVGDRKAIAAAARARIAAPPAAAAALLGRAR